MLQVADLRVQYGRVAAVRELSLSVEEGQLVGLVGHNGVGKSTTLWTITGALRPASGSITFAGRQIAGLAPDAILRHGIALVPENRRVFARLTVGENLAIGTTARRDRAQARADVRAMCERFPVLGTTRDRKASALSGGEQQQLAIARALLSRPRLLLLDEPTLGLAPIIVDRVFDTLEELRREGMTILLVEQNAARTIETADHTYILRTGGRLAMHGTREELAGRTGLELEYTGLR